MRFSSDVHDAFILRPVVRSWPLRATRRVWSIAVLVLVVTLNSGCGMGPGATGSTVKDPAPLAPEETTEALFKSKPQAKGRQAYKAQRR
jgi:hypothetical protein